MNKEIQNTKDNIDYKVDWVSKNLLILNVLCV